MKCYASGGSGSSKSGVNAPKTNKVSSRSTVTLSRGRSFIQRIVNALSSLRGRRA